MRVIASSFLRFLDHTQRCTTLGRTPLDEWSARRRDLYLTTCKTHKRKISIPPGGIRVHNVRRLAAADIALDHAATGTGQTKPIVYHRENRHLNVVPRAGWTLESVQARKDERNVLPPQGIEPRLHFRRSYNLVTIPTAPFIPSSFSQYYYTTPHPHTHTPGPHCQATRSTWRKTIYTLSGRKSTFRFDYRWLCSVTYHSGAREPKRDPVITGSYQKAIGQILGPYWSSH
jgi:hypothetical protein